MSIKFILFITAGMIFVSLAAGFLIHVFYDVIKNPTEYEEDEFTGKSECLIDNESNPYDCLTGIKKGGIVMYSQIEYNLKRDGTHNNLL